MTPRRKHGEQGLTLVEALVTLAVLMTVMTGLYGLLDSSNKVAKQETNVAEAQQSARIGTYELGRVIRQARVGALYYGNAILPVANNSPGGKSLTDLNGQAHYIRQGTDVIGVRGILLGDRYAFDPGDVSCAGSCATTSAITVTIRKKTRAGFVNFTSGGATPGPGISLANRTRPFYFVVMDATNQLVTVGGSNYLAPLYYVGLVDTAGTWYTQTTDSFRFTMNPQNAGAKRFGAPTSGVTADLAKPFSGGAVDEIVFFVDEGKTDASSSVADSHPALAEAMLDAQTGNFDIQPLVEEVEDFQVAYGVDGIGGLPRDKGVSPAVLDLTGVNKDEWVGNVSTEVETTLAVSSTDPKRVDAFVDTSMATGGFGAATAAAALRSVWVSLVAKSTDPDFVYDGPGARGIKVLDSTARSFSAPSSTGRPYRRRLQSFAVSLRNYQ
jgi:Tfp pilus assembly protein PilV